MTREQLLAALKRVLMKIGGTAANFSESFPRETEASTAAAFSCHSAAIFDGPGKKTDCLKIVPIINTFSCGFWL